MLIRLLIILILSPPVLAETNITVLDVKEGLSILISSENKGVLIDTGHAGKSQNLLQKLSKKNIHKIEKIILTHLHPDHASGYFRLKEEYPNTIIYSSCQPLPHDISPDITRWVYESLNKDKMHRCIKANDTLNFYDIKMKVLWPYEFKSFNLNHHSLVLSLEHEGELTLVMGDAGISAEEQLLDRDVLPDKVTTLIVGHHGANDASSKAFIKKLQPDTAIISINKNNIRGYPSEHVINRLLDNDIKVLKTYEAGDIELLNKRGR